MASVSIHNDSICKTLTNMVAPQFQLEKEEEGEEEEKRKW